MWAATQSPPSGYSKSPPPCGEVEMLKRRQPRGISGVRIVADTIPTPPKLLAFAHNFGLPQRGEAMV